MTGIMVSAATGVMNSVLGKLTNLLGEEVAKIKGLRNKVQFLKDELSSMNILLEKLADMEVLDPETKDWRNRVREMSYDIEDIIDNFVDRIGNKSANSGLIQSLKTLKARYQIGGQIEKIRTVVQDASERRQRYKIDNPIAMSSSVSIDKRVLAIYANVADLVGMEGPMDELVEMLHVDEKELKVVPIVGFGGLGKTTLANQVYNKMKDGFECKTFVSVSQKPDITRLLSNLLSQLKGRPSCHGRELHNLIDDLRNHLHDKSYFIIIDDLWGVKEWDVIKCAFPKNNHGSRLIVTTRIQSVAGACCSNHDEVIFKMKSLGEEDSRRLFFGRIFGSEDSCPAQFKGISLEILKKCGGLPLAINSIASLLASEEAFKTERFEYVRDSLSSISGRNRTLEEMRQILKLSYTDLPGHLKTCFLYLGIYPEDHEIVATDLIHQWTAQDFVSKEQEQDAEKVATSYLNELINRSLVQPIFDIDGLLLACKVHDMMLDLILTKCAEENFITVVNVASDVTKLQHKARRLSLRSDLSAANANNHTGPLANMCLSQIRAFAIFGTGQHMPPLSAFKIVRVLVLDFPTDSRLDDRNIDLTGLGKLYQLRYLKIKGGCRFLLPTKISVLQHLETFDIDDGDSIPSDVVHLPGLLHLIVPRTTRLPDGISNMKSLRSLNLFNLTMNSLDNIKGLAELTNLSNLSLGVSGSYSRDEIDAHLGVLCSSLGNHCSLVYMDLDYEGNCIDGLSTMSPPRRLERLFLINSWFSRVPMWMTQLHNLWDLQLMVAELHQDGVAILAELPALTNLRLIIRRSQRERIVFSGSSFLLLRKFVFSCKGMPYVTIQAGAMRNLQSLLLQFNAQGWEQNGTAPAGIEHLSALQKISARIACYNAPESDRIDAESAFRNATIGCPSVSIELNENWTFLFDDL